MRIAVAGLVHETNTYASPTDYGDFSVFRGREIVDVFGAGLSVGGFLAAAAEIGAEVVPTYWAGTYPSGTIRQAAYERMRSELLDALQDAQPFDAIALELHGAAIAEQTLDVEGDLGRCLRERFPGIPIVCAADLHGTFTDAMNEAYDAVLPVELYPHTDTFARGSEAVHLVPGLLDGTLLLTTEVVRLPMILPCTTTDAGSPGERFVEWIRAAERHPRVVDCSIWHGFPYADTPDAGVRIAVTTRSDAPLARAVAEDIAAQLWEVRDDFLPAALTPENAVAAAARVTGGPVVVNEASDNPGGGTPGDGTHLLRALLAADLPDTCFALISDPDVVAASMVAGVGATVDVELGGKTDDLHGAPLPVRARVRAITDGTWTSRAYAPGMQLDHGRMVRLAIGNVDVLVSEKRSQVYEPEVFLLHGIDVSRCRIVGVKGAHHFRAGFRAVASVVITADSPGLSSVDLAAFARTRLDRPVWPLDAAVERGRDLTPASSPLDEDGATPALAGAFRARLGGRPGVGGRTDR